MAVRDRDESHDHEIAQLIQRKAAKLARGIQDRHEEQQDIEQDLHIRWLEIRSQYDPSKGDIVTFADIALNNYIRNLIATRRAQRRTGRTDGKIDPCATARLVYPESSGSGDQDDIEQIGREPDYETLALRIDFRRALRKLNPELRAIAEARVGNSITEIARSLKLSRPTVYQRIGELQAILKEHGVDEYLR
jgi:RNA polymerase sigma factor (sigma-70 family)